MQRSRTGCLVALLILTVLVVALALGAAYFLLDWTARGEPVSVRLPWLRPLLSGESGQTSTSLTPKLPLPSVIPTPAVTIPTPTPGGLGSGSSPEPLVLVDPTLADLASELTDVQSGQSVRISMSEAALQAELYAYLSGYSNAGYQFKSVDLRPDQLVIAGKGQIDALVVNLAITVRPYVTDCWFAVQVENVKLGMFPAPGFITDEVQTYINQWTDAYQKTGVVCITEIRVTEDQMILAGNVL